MKTIKTNWIKLAGLFGGGLLVVATALTALSQTSPFLTVAPTGTNQLAITIGNAGISNNYDLQWTPTLANTATYPWTIIAVGTPGQTNFTVSTAVSPTGFYRALWDTNSIPLWEAADPNNPSAGILSVFIDSPANGAVLQ